jgi:hypothetical protein
MTRKLLTIVLIGLSLVASGQDVSDLLSSAMENTRAKNYQQLNERPLYDSANLQIVLANLRPYLADTAIAIRAKAYRILRNVGLATEMENIRNYVVNQLIDGVRDIDSGIAGIAVESLTNFRKQNFDIEVQRKLSDLLATKPPFYDKVLLLAGFVELIDQRGLISNMLLTDTLLNDKSRWAAHLALARMGVQEEVSYVVNKVKRYPVNDDVVYELLPDLAYIRQPLAVDYLFEVVNSDAKGCETADPESTAKILCGYRVLEYLAPILQGFPYQIDDSGDLITDDYRQVLADVRQWYTNNSGYVIIKDTF